jgi:GNAT superfamily N-acetyltransferase
MTKGDVNIVISNDKALLSYEKIYEFLAKSYWANERSKEKIDLSIQNSLCFGVYDGVQQIGFARVVTDFATIYWVCDVYVDVEYQGQGVGKKLLKHIVEFSELKGLRAILRTRDAQTFYQGFGFEVVNEEFMRKQP